ncbi:MAG: HAD-IA family hydrolase [Candidatus Bipolaricaulota bacterium]|nr:MAG: HAD-IA family hydrolase [Candidatus Bipolaricaulota bacterium]
MLRALVFDFDGLILDTETPRYEAWREIFAEHGCELPLAEWIRVIGRAPGDHDPTEILQSCAGRPLDRGRILRDHERRENRRIAELSACPGVVDLIGEACAAGLALAVASSSDHPWVAGHLRRLGLHEAFAVISCASSEVAAKPAPDVYDLALRELGVTAAEAVAFEDSHHGVDAATAAGIACVAVPNRLTRTLAFPDAALRVDTLEGLDVSAIASLVERRTPRRVDARPQAKPARRRAEEDR